MSERKVTYLRVPLAMHDLIGCMATKNQRSLNAEILFALTAYYEGRQINLHDAAHVRALIAMGSLQPDST